MADETTIDTTPAPEQANTPAPAPEPAPAPHDIAVDAANVVHGAVDVAHDAERNTRHGLSHLIDEAKHVFVDIPEAKLHEVFAWLAGKL